MKISTGQAVVGENFFGRKRELNRLAEVYQAKAANAFIPGPRRIGKTSLVKEFIRLHEEHYRIVYFDLEGRYSIVELCKDLLDEIDSSFPGFVKSRGKLREMWNNAAQMIKEIEVGGVIKVKTGELQKTVRDVINKMEGIFEKLYYYNFIFALDEFSDFLLNLKKNNAEDVKLFLEWLRRLRQQEKIRIIITGSINIISTMEELDFPHLINDMTDIEIYPLKPDEVVSLLTELLKSKRITLSSKVLEFAVEKLGDGIPCYIQLFADGVCSYGGEGRSIEQVEEIQDIYKRITGKQHKEFSHFHSRFKEHLTRQENEAARKVLAHTCQSPMSFDDLHPYVKDILPDKAAFNKLLKRLMDECYLKKSDGRYGFVSPMLADWWKNQYEWER